MVFLLNKVLNNLTSYSNADVQPIIIGQSGSLVYRLVQPGGESVILKITQPKLMPEYLTVGYPKVASAEYNFYLFLGPRLGLPCPKLLACGDLERSATYILIEDLSSSYYIPNEDHRWSTAEMLAVASVYGAMHGRTHREFTHAGIPAWLNPDPRTTYNPEEALGCLQELAGNSWTSAAKPIYNSLNRAQILLHLTSKLKHIPSVLLYNDFYPPNVALAQDLSGAQLIDYQLIGSGVCHIDIVNIGFLSESEAFKQVDSEAVLAKYLLSLYKNGGEKITPEIFWRDYKHAELLAWADFLPRFVRAMHRSNVTGEPWGKWMDETFAKCMRVFSRALAL